MNMTPEETEDLAAEWSSTGEERCAGHGCGSAAGRPAAGVDEETAVNMLCDKLTDARALAASWMTTAGSRERETKMILEEYRARMAEELKKLDWQHPADKESSAYRLLSEAKPGQTAEHTGLDSHCLSSTGKE